mgnify:FL=1
MFVLYFLVLIAEVIEATFSSTLEVLASSFEVATSFEVASTLEVFSSTLEVTVASLEVAVASLETFARASVIVVVVAASCRTCLVATTDVLAVFLEVGKAVGMELE